MSRPLTLRITDSRDSPTMLHLKVNVEELEARPGTDHPLVAMGLDAIAYRDREGIAGLQIAFAPTRGDPGTQESPLTDRC